MAKSLTETAKMILEGEIPSVSPNDRGSPDRDAKSTTTAKSSLKPGKTESRFANPKATSEGEFDDVDDLGGATPTSTAKENLGAKAAGKTSKDKSKPTSDALAAEPGKKAVAMAEETEEVEISEELEAFIEKMMEEGYSEDEIAEAIEENFELVSEEKHDEKEDEDSDDDDDDDEKKEEEAEKAAMTKKMMKEHVDALLAGETDLSEDFRTKAETIFESAVSVRVNEEVQVLEEAYAQALTEEVEKIRTELTEQVDDYLNYVVEQWMSENEVAIESGLRTEITEDFISGLRNLFAEHYIDIPEDKVSIVEELGSRVASLESKLNEEIERNVEMTKVLAESQANEVLMAACDGLTTTQAAKLKKLAENVDFTTAEEFESKVLTLRESYFSEAPVNSSQVLDNTDVSDGKMITEETGGRMAAYTRALGKSLPK